MDYAAAVNSDGACVSFNWKHGLNLALNVLKYIDAFIYVEWRDMMHTG